VHNFVFMFHMFEIVWTVDGNDEKPSPRSTGRGAPAGEGSSMSLH